MINGSSPVRTAGNIWLMRALRNCDGRMYLYMQRYEPPVGAGGLACLVMMEKNSKPASWPRCYSHVAS